MTKLSVIGFVTLPLLGCARNRATEVATPAECGYPRPGGPLAYAEREVDDLPRLLFLARDITYSEAQRREGKEGHETFAFVIDDAGLVLEESVHVLVASDSALIPPAREALIGAHFTPAKLQGRSVAVCVRQTFNWVLS